MNYRTVKLTVYSLAMWQAALVAKHCLGQTFGVPQGGSSGHKARPATLSLTLSWLCRSEGSVTLSCISSSYFPIFASCQEKTLLERDFELHSAGAQWCTVFWGVLSWCLSNIGCTESATGIDIEWCRQRCWSDLVSQKWEWTNCESGWFPMELVWS